MLVRDEAEILKKVDFDWEAMHFPINVFPVPKQQIVNSFSSRLNYIESTKIIKMQLEATVQLETIKRNLPGGPKRRTPFGGPLSPVKISGLNIGQTTISLMVFLAKSSPEISSHPIVKPIHGSA